jgi:SAM-dependent methyltransferase
MNATATCPACGGNDARSFLEVPGVPVECNLLLDSETAARSQPRGDIALALCRRCGMIWNTRFDPGLERYDVRYENSLWSSPTFAAYAEALIDRLIERYDIRGKRVLGIGSGRGEFLAELCQRGDNEALGFDPAYDLTEGLPGSHVHVVPDFFRDRYAEIRADVVICRHVLEHLEDPAGLLRLIHRTLEGRPGGMTYIEVPNAAYMLRSESVWDVIYEHPHYFVEEALAGLARRSGLRVEHVFAGYGDQYLGMEAVPDEGTSADDLSGEAVAVLEDATERFADSYRSTIDSWGKRLADWSRSGRRLVLWGAGSKGVMFLNSVPEAGSIEGVVDINPRKQGHHVAGTGQRIIAPEELADRGADVVIAMNPLYREEIGGSLDALGVHANVVLAAPSAAA